MDKWEYAEIVLAGVMGNSVYAYLYENGKITTLKGFTESSPVLQALTLLGEEGWELVSTVNSGTASNQTLYLKRKLSI